MMDWWSFVSGLCFGIVAAPWIYFFRDAVVKKFISKSNHPKGAA
jgi:hypothetical protein